MLDVSLRAGAALDVPVDAGSTVFLLPILGGADGDRRRIEQAHPPQPRYTAGAAPRFDQAPPQLPV